MLKEVKEASVQKAISTAEDLENYIYAEYRKYDTELNSLFFDVMVSMKECDILQTYKEIQRTINGDSVVRLTNILVDDTDNITGEEAADFIPEGQYQNIYAGNCKDFLEDFNGKEMETGFCRFDEANLLDFIF